MPEKNAHLQTELEQCSAALQASEARFRNIIARSADGIIIVDAGGTISFVNPAAESLFGRKAAELTGQVFGFPVVAGETSELAIVSRKEERAIIEMRVVETEWEGERAFLANLRDITGQKKTVEALRESEERYSALVHASSQALYRMSADWSEMLRVEGGRFIPDTEQPDRNWLQQYVHPDDQKQVLETIDRAVRAGTVFELEHRVLQVDGTVGWTSSRAVPVRNADGQIVEWFGAASDITERKRAEELLRETEQKLRNIVEHSTNLFYMHGTDHVLRYVSPQSRSFFDCEPEEALAHWNEFITGNPGNRVVIEATQRAIDTGIPQPPYQVECIGRKGRKIWVEVNEAPVVENGRTVAIVGSLTDITDRKQAEEEREKLLVQLEAVLNSINEGVVIADLSGNILSMNSSALAFHEYATVEQVRKQLHQLLDTFEVSDLEGRTVPFEQWPLSRVLRGEQVTDLEVRVKRKDTGTTRIGSYSGTPVQTRSGDVIFAVITVLDITERKRAEAEIQRLASFPLLNPNPVLELDADGQITFCNPAASQILKNGGHVASTNPFIPRDLPEILQNLRDSKPGQFLRSIEIDGRFFEELVYVSPQFQAVRIYTMEITRRKRAEEQIEILNTKLAARAAELEDANRELEAFNYTVAHDLRNPLNVISSYCQVIKELCSDRLDEQCKNYLQETYNGTLRMNGLIGALLQFSRLAHTELKRDKVDLSSMAKEIAGELRGAEGARRVEIRITDGIVADGDAALLRVVLANLLGNAWKYTGKREGAIIEFGLSEVDGRAFFVRDNGPGFDMKNADKLFTPFQRLPGAEECRGFGIGLATVERIIRRHGGQVWAEGEPGKGATFWFTLRSQS